VLTELRTTSAHSPNRDHHLVWHPRGELLAAGCGDGTIKVWQAATGAQIQNLKGHTANVRSLSWSPDGLRLVSASEDRTIRIWDAETGRELLRLPCRSGSYTSAAWSPNGRVIAVSHEPVWILDATLGYDSAAKLTAAGQRP